MKESFLLSVIVPVYNEQDNIAPLIKNLLPVLKKYEYEIIFIDDGSKDKTVDNIKRLAGKNNRIKLVSFMRNFGHQMALTCGYQTAKGDAVVSMDADLQDPPQIISQMVDLWKKGNKVVYAQRGSRNADDPFKRLTAKWFYKFINMLSDVPIPREVGDFRLLDREVVDFLVNLPEQSRFLRGLVAWSGQPAAFVTFSREKRNAGETHYTLSKMINFAVEGITSFSIKPLRLAALLGFMTSIFSVLIIAFKTIQHFVFGLGDWLPGWASLFFSILFLGGVQLITIGIIGEYIGKIYHEVQKRPQYLVKEKVNL